MNRYLLLIISVVALASCSSPKYTYYFDHYDYNSGRKDHNLDKPLPNEERNGDKNPLTLDDRTLTASTDGKVVAIPAKEEINAASKASITKEVKSPADIARHYKEMSKVQRKEFRKAMRADMRKFVMPSKKSKNDNSINSIAETKVMDHDLKMAIIFGAVGLTLSLFGGVNSVFWVLSVISVVVGVVFLIKWLSRQ